MQNTDTETIGDTVERKRSDLVEHYTDWMPDNHTMPELKAQKSFQERGYQNSLVDELCQLFQHAEYAYLEAATGTGKTLIIALLAERLRLEHVTYVVHSIDILNQAQQDILDYVDAGLISQEIEWRFLTWQAYARKMRWVFTDDDSKPDPFVVVDECHMGGVLDVQSVKKSFSVIVNKAKKILWVSATPWELDEKLMGARQGHTAYYGYKEAYDEGILNKTELVRVDCGLDITLTRNQENLSARELLKHEKDTLEIEGASADATFEQLNLEVRRALGRGLRTTDVPLLVQHRYQLMAQLYVAMHRDEKAIFWLPTKQHARMCAEYINRQMESETAAIAVTGDVRYDDDSQHKLADWRNPSGIIKVACVVYRLREGFDFPQLTYGFDCAWNAYNYRAAVQKIGRLVRRSARKSTSIYYYAVDAISIAAAHNREFANHFTGQLQKVYSDEDLTMTAAALADTAKLLQEVNFSSNHVVKAPTIESYAVGSEIVRATKIALFDVIDATGHLERDRIDLTDIFEGPKVQKADQIVADIEAGRLKMPSLSDSHGSTGDILRRVVSPYRSCYRPDLRERLIKCGALIPKESSISAAREKLERLVSEIERGDAKYGVKHPEYRWIWKYTNPKNTVFRPDIRERLIKCGALIPKIRTTSTES